MQCRFIQALSVCCIASFLASASPLSAQSTPHLFAPGVVSTEDFEFDASFTPDGKTVFFSKGDPSYNRITVVESHLRGDRWTEPEVAPFSGVWKDTDAHVSPDGRRIFFVSNRPTDGSQEPRKDYDIWYVEAQQDKTWSSPHHLGSPINTDGNEAYPSVTKDGTLYFEASRSDHPGTHIYRSRMLNGEYETPELLNFAGKANDINPAVASDESFMIFASRDRGGEGGSDLFISFMKPDRTWTTPTNMGASINSRFAETAPALSPNNRKLYFASSRIDEPLVRTTPATYKQLEHELHEIQNGLYNIYEVDLNDVQRFAKP